MEDIRRTTIRQVNRRILWFSFVLFIFGSLDRTNVGFAALQMNEALHFSPQVFGFGVSMFFISFTMLQVPNSMAFQKVGPRACLTVMLVAWGIIGCATALVHDATTFYILRFMLGVAEAGFPPGIIYLASLWIPKEARGTAASKNMLAIATAAIIGAPLSGWLLGQHPFGLAGWQWMFIAEGLPATVIGIGTWFYLPDSPAKARWLTAEQRRWLVDQLAEERQEIRQRGEERLRDALKDGRVWLLFGVWFGVQIGVSVLSFWMPLAIKQVGHIGSDMEVGILAMLPWIGAFCGAVANARHSDRTLERAWHVGGAMLLGAGGLLLCSVPIPAVAFLGIVVAGIGLGAAHAVFWTVPMGFLTGAAAAGGYGLINLVGNLAGIVGPNLIGYIRQQTGSYNLALFVVVALLVACGLLLIPVTGRNHARARRTPARTAARP